MTFPSAHDAQLFLVPPKVVDQASMRGKHLRNQQAELAIAKHGDGRAWRQRELVENLAGRGQRLCKDR